MASGGEGADEEVRATNDDAADAKMSCVSLHYFADPFLPCFVGSKAQRKSPLMNRGTYSRVVAVERAMEWFISLDLPGFAKEERQVVSLGAGFDTAFFRLRERGVCVGEYWEVDFPEIVDKKRRVIARTHTLQEFLQAHHIAFHSHSSPTSSSSPSPASPSTPSSHSSPSCTSSHYRLISADLRDVSKLHDLFVSAGVDFSLPTLFLSECVLAYLDSKSGSSVIHWTAEAFPLSFFVTYEQILPNDSFGKMMMQNLQRRGCPLRSINDYPDLPQQKERYIQAGYSHVSAVDMYEYYTHYIPHDERQRIERLEWMDEFEEWVLIQTHYCILCAIRDASVLEKNPLPLTPSLSSPPPTLPFMH